LIQKTKMVKFNKIICNTHFGSAKIIILRLENAAVRTKKSELSSDFYKRRVKFTTIT